LMLWSNFVALPYQDACGHKALVVAAAVRLCGVGVVVMGYVGGAGPHWSLLLG
jgi:hypothetical protein